MFIILFYLVISLLSTPTGLLVCTIVLYGDNLTLNDIFINNNNSGSIFCCTYLVILSIVLLPLE